MASIKIEMDRGNGWEIRAECEAAVTADQLADMLTMYAIQYPHRAFFNGALIATAKPVRGKGRGKVVRV